MFEAVLDFVFANIIWFIVAGVGVFFAVQMFRVTSRAKVRTVNVADIERMKFIERMKNNKPDSLIKWLYRDKHLLGKVIAIRTLTSKKGNPKNTEITQLLVKPMLSTKLNIPRPFSKVLPVQVNTDIIRMDTSTKELRLPKWTTFDYFMGIYYDNSLKEEEHKDIIIDHNLFRSTAQQIASTFFSKSQEQSTFDPEHAHALAMKEKELQIEMAKKKGKVTSI